MKRAWFVLVLLALGLSRAAARSEEPALPLAAAFERFLDLVEEGDVAAAEAFAEPWLADGSVLERERAGLRFGLGLVGGRSAAHAHWERAVEHFSSARALAGPGEARLDATYNAGVIQLQEGERQRALLPEIQGGSDPALAVPPGMPALPGAPGGAPGGAAPVGPGADPEAQEEDPLVLALRAYEQARETLTERLRADWRDSDTRANLELIQRRLAQLDEIERQRAEQQQEQQDQKGEGEPQQSDDGEGQDGEPQENQDGEKQPSREDQEGQDAEPRQQEQREQDGEPSEPPDEGEGGEQPEQPQDEGPGELEPPPAAEEPQAGEAQPGEPTERHLTKEEVMRLLDRLAELEEQGRQVEAQLRRASRQSVERDW